MTATFDEWRLHDAVVYEIVVDWNQRTCRMTAAAFMERGAAAVPCVLLWTGVRSARISIEEPWGPSAYVNSQKQEGRVFRIEMQSGDDIVIEADAVVMSVSPTDRQP